MMTRQKLFGLFSILLIFFNLHSQEMPGKIYLKSGEIIGFDKLKAGKYGLTDSQDLQITYLGIDSIYTADSSFAKEIMAHYNFLIINKKNHTYIINGFDDIVNNVININAEIKGKTIIAGINLGFVYNRKHSLDFCYADGVTDNGKKKLNVKKLFIFNYSYLFGGGRYKVELGGGYGTGTVEYTELLADFLPRDTIDAFSGPILNAVLGVRYQSEKTGLLFKIGFTPILFLKPRTAVKYFFSLGIGFTIGI